MNNDSKRTGNDIAKQVAQCYAARIDYNHVTRDPLGLVCIGTKVTSLRDGFIESPIVYSY